MDHSFPQPALDDPYINPFWEAAAQGRLALPKRRSDGRFIWYPEGDDLEWVTLPGTGKLFSWVKVIRPLHAGYAAIAPYVSAIVEPDGAPGVRLVTRLIGETGELKAGAPVVAKFVDIGTPGPDVGVIGPLFALR